MDQAVRQVGMYPSQAPAPAVEPKFTERKSPRIKLSLLSDVVVLLFIAGFYCFYGQSAASIDDGDQIGHVNVVQEMLQSGDYLHPRKYGLPYYNKPPFQMWISAAIVSVLGESNFSYRLVNSLGGIGTALLLYYAGMWIFASRRIAFISALAMFACHIFLFSHGVRTATQDGLMLFLVSCGTLIGFVFVESVTGRRPALVADTWKLAGLGGLVIGLGVLTKHVAGLYPLAIIFAYTIFSGSLLTVLARAWRQILLILLLSCLPLATFVLLQGELSNRAFRTLFFREIWNRATQGYHNVGREWFYWRDLVYRHKSLPPFVLIFAGLFGIANVALKKNREALFLLCWFGVPFIAQSLASSKLSWYVLPGVPGGALLIGVAANHLMQLLAPSYRRWLTEGKALGAAPLALTALLIAGSAEFSFHLFKTARTVLSSQDPDPADQLVRDLRLTNGSAISNKKVGLFRPNGPAQHERFYFNMERNRFVDFRDAEDVARAIQNKEISVLLTQLSLASKFMALSPVISYQIFRPRHARKSHLAALNFDPEFHPKGFSPPHETIELMTGSAAIVFGWKDPAPLLNQLVRPNYGESSGLIIPSSKVLNSLGARLELDLASVLPEQGKKLRLEFLFNDRPLGNPIDIDQGFHPVFLPIPAELFESQQNLLVIRPVLPSKRKPANEEQVFLIRGAKLWLGTSGPAIDNSNPM